MSKKIKVEQPNLVAFVLKIEELVNEGYRVSGTNAGVPTTWGPGLYICEMLNDDFVEPTVEEVEKPVEVTQEIVQTLPVEKVEEKVAEEVKPKTTTRRRKSSK